jgi:hypothetical protein
MSDETDKNTPTHRAYYVAKKNESDSKPEWLELGAVWPHKDGKGFDVVLKLMPIEDFNGRITLRAVEPRS